MDGVYLILFAGMLFALSSLIRGTIRDAKRAMKEEEENKKKELRNGHSEHFDSVL